jgi:hypothetical protein
MATANVLESGAWEIRVATCYAGKSLAKGFLNNPL